MFTVDAHLDLAYNAVARGRDVTAAAKLQPTLSAGDLAREEVATVGLPDLRAGHVGLICATIFCEPAGPTAAHGYRDADGARAQALAQLNWYREQCDAGRMRMVRTAADLPSETATGDEAIPFILLLEGADAIRSAADVGEWFDAGVRIVGMAWKRTRYAGGTGEPGPLTDAGVELVRELDRLGIIHDASHLAEESFWQLNDLTKGPLIASHSNARSIVGSGDRHLSNDMIRAITARGGVIGINFFDRFLLPKPADGKPTRRATLHDVFNHVKHISNITGDLNQVGLGTDMDGGLGRDQIPQEIETSADLPRVGDALRAYGLPPLSVKNVMGHNWLRYFNEHLPKG